MLPESDEYYVQEKKWLVDDLGCVPRYLRASKWKLEEAKKRITGTLEWVCYVFDLSFFDLVCWLTSYVFVIGLQWDCMCDGRSHTPSLGRSSLAFLIAPGVQARSNSGGRGQGGGADGEDYPEWIRHRRETCAVSPTRDGEYEGESKTNSTSCISHVSLVLLIRSFDRSYFLCFCPMLLEKGLSI